MDPVLGAIATKMIIGGLIGGMLEEQKRVKERERQVQELHNQLIILGVKGAISLVTSLVEKRTKQRGIDGPSEK